MRYLILLVALGLAGCGDDGATNNTSVAEAGEATNFGSGNDATAIDAATGESADMAADVDYTFNEDVTNELGSDAANAAGDNSSSD